MSKTIKKLTPEQEALLPEYRDRWLEVGLCTDPAVREEAEAGIVESYKDHGNTPPDNIIWVGSIFAGAYIAHLIAEDLPYKEALKAPKQHFDDGVLVSKRDLLSRTGPSFYNVEEIEGAAADFFTQDKITKSDLQSQLNRACFGQHACGFLGFWEFLRDEMDVEEGHKLNGQMKVAKAAGWWWPFESIAIVSERHSKMELDLARVNTHCDQGYSLGYADGWGMYSMGGTTVDPWMANMPANELDPLDVLKIQNVQVRAQMVRKIGLERQLLHPNTNAKSVSSGEGYDLLHLQGITNDNNEQALFLKMENPSVAGMIHVEGVPSHLNGVATGIDTWQKALAWRNRDKTYVKPEQLT